MRDGGGGVRTCQEAPLLFWCAPECPLPPTTYKAFLCTAFNLGREPPCDLGQPGFLIRGRSSPRVQNLALETNVVCMVSRDEASAGHWHWERGLPVWSCSTSKCTFCAWTNVWAGLLAFQWPLVSEFLSPWNMPNPNHWLVWENCRNDFPARSMSHRPLGLKYCCLFDNAFRFCEYYFDVLL